jgi:hypothetical protein
MNKIWEMVKDLGLLRKTKVFPSVLDLKLFITDLDPTFH